MAWFSFYKYKIYSYVIWKKKMGKIAQLPGNSQAHPLPLPGCAPGSSATLGSGPGVVPGSEAGRQKLGSDGLRCKVSGDHPPPPRLPP